MRTQHSHGNGRIQSIQDALDFLNTAAEERADRLRAFFTDDYQNLKRILTDTAPEVEAAARGFRKKTLDAARTLDDSAHENAWVFVAGAAALASIVGFMIGRRSMAH